VPDKIDLAKVKRYSVHDRITKSECGRFGQPPRSMRPFFDSLPDYLKAADLRNLANDLIKAKRRKRAIVWLMGAHPLKVGLSPIIIDFMKRGFISHIALNGAGAIHDLEIAFWGRTSEEVADTLQDGNFGMVYETPEYLARAVAQSPPDCGLGDSIGRFIIVNKPRYRKFSLIAAAVGYGITVSIHVAIGTDTICQHPEFDGGQWGAKSQIDFRIFAARLKKLNGGGVVLNIGSAVVLPEVFLKALTVARNIEGKITDFTAANFDMIQHYRPNENVVRRPTLGGGKGYSFTGHHEIMLPLLAAAVRSYER